MTTRVTVDYLPSRAGKSVTLVVVYRGMQAVTSLQAGPLIADWQTSGYDVLVVDSQDDRYDIDDVARTTAHRISGLISSQSYGEIIFVGLSMGGVAAADTALLLNQTGVLKGVGTLLVLNDSPLSTKTVASPGWAVKLIAAVPFGAVANKVPVVKWLSKPADEALVEPGADRSAIQASFQRAQKVPLSRWASELGSFALHRAYQPGELAFFDSVVFIRSSDAGPIKPDNALAEWEAATGRVINVIPVTAPHVGILEAPRAYVEAYGRAFS